MSQHEERGERGWRVRARAAGSRVGGAVKGAWGWVRRVLLRPVVIAAVAVGGWILSRKVVIGVAAVLAVIVLVPDLVRDRVEAVDRMLPWRGYDDGLILLNTPQVFTRSRLVNDRATEGAWLSAQLNRTSELLNLEKFGQPSFVRMVQRQMLLSKDGAGGASPVGSEDIAKQLTGLKLSPAEQLRDAIAYREEIRNRQLSTVLDDRHDIEGNTIYRLNFSATVVPPHGSDRLAAVVVHLSESRPPLQHALNERYVELMHDWAGKLQSQLVDIINDRLFLIERDNSLSPDEAKALHEWLLMQIEDRVKEATGVGGVEELKLLLRKMEADTDQFAVRGIEEMVKTSGAKASVNRNNDDAERAAGDAQSEAGRSADGKNNQPRPDPIREAATILHYQCKSDGRMNLRKVPGVTFPDDAEEKLSCPPTRPFGSSMRALISIVDIIRNVTERVRLDPTLVQCQRTTETYFLLLDATVFGPPPQRQQPGSGPQTPNWSAMPLLDACKLFGGYMFAERMSVDTRIGRRAVVAEFQVYHTLQKVPKTDVRNIDGSLLTIRDLFEIKLPASCGIGACDPVVEPREDYRTASLALAALQGMLRQRATAFTYEVVPDRQALFGQAVEADSAALSMSRVNLTLGAAVKSAAASNVTMPTIMGFGDFGLAHHAVGAQNGTTKFGWIMFPRADQNWNWFRRHVPEKYAVTAFVSVPGWWKTAVLNIQTCWVSDRSIARTVDPVNICMQEPSWRARKRVNEYALQLRLPGDSDAAVQNLRFEVLAYPYLKRPLADPVVEIGRAANLLITGGRLWRSPVVRLGAQQAQSIEVLPDMQGIVAKFDCVLPAAGTAGVKVQYDRSNVGSSPNSGKPSTAKSDNPSAAKMAGPTGAGQHATEQKASGDARDGTLPLVVVTSEGMTLPMQVLTRPFTMRHGEDNRRPGRGQLISRRAHPVLHCVIPAPHKRTLKSAAPRPMVRR
jgi:hypothetical protein